MNLESHFWQKRHNGDHGDTVYTIQSSSNHSHTSSKESEPLKEQWISLLEVHTAFDVMLREGAQKLIL